jgi:hypothetical protein
VISDYPQNPGTGLMARGRRRTGSDLIGRTLPLSRRGVLVLDGFVADGRATKAPFTALFSNSD